MRNKTAARARKQNEGMTFVDAPPDLVASLKYARDHYAKGKLLALGSSYSAALILKVAGDHPDLLDGVSAFSPGEYFGRLGQGEAWIRDSAQHIKCPTFITSGGSERKLWQPIFERIPKKTRTFFLPTTKGNHGARALWEQLSDSSAYWKAVETFLLPFLEETATISRPPLPDSEG